MTEQQTLIEVKLEQKEKPILDITSAFRSMWFDKNNPLVDFLDKDDDEELNERRKKYNRLCGTNKFKYWAPPNKTIQGTWNNLPFPDNSKKLIVFDPPHKKKMGERSKFKQLYGDLQPETWQSELKKAFKEAFRVLEPEGFLVLKWGSDDINHKEILACSQIKPLFGNISHGANKHKNSITYWFLFMKPKTVSQKLSEKEETT